MLGRSDVFNRLTSNEYERLEKARHGHCCLWRVLTERDEDLVNDCSVLDDFPQSW